MVVGQVRDIERDVAGDEGLESGLAAQKLERKRKQECGVRARKDEKGVNERIGFNESSVEVDAERPENFKGRFRRREDLRQLFTSTRGLPQSGHALLTTAKSSQFNSANSGQGKVAFKYTSGAD
jgi:hypothetical protein